MIKAFLYVLGSPFRYALSLYNRAFPADSEYYPAEQKKKTVELISNVKKLKTYSLESKAFPARKKPSLKQKSTHTASKKHLLELEKL